MHDSASVADTANEAGAADTSASDADAHADWSCTGAATDPCWVRMEGLPGHCDVWRAQHPERLVTAVPTSCGPGCSLLDFGPYWGHAGEGGWIDADGEHYVHLAGGTPDSYVDALVRTDGRTVFAVRYPPNGGTISVETCWSRSFGVGEGFASFVVQWALGPDNVPAEDLVYYAALAELATVATPVRTIDTSGTFGVLQLAVSSRGVAWEREAGGQGVIDGSYVDLGPGVHHPRMLGGDLVWINQSGQLHVWSAGVDTMLLDIAPLIADGGVLTDGTSIAWFEFMDSVTGSPSTLRVGPFVYTAAAFTPRVLEGPPMTLPAVGVMGDGLIAHEDYAPSFVGYRVVDVATGGARRFVPPAGQHPEYLHLVSSTELAAETHDAAGYRLYVVDPTMLPVVP